MDGVVDVDDLLEVILNPGPCAANDPCFGDVNLDCVVDKEDQDLVGDNRGPCVSVEALSSNSIQPWMLELADLTWEGAIPPQVCAELILAGQE